MTRPLDRIEAKIERAVQHIQEFESGILRFERDAYAVRLEPNISAGKLSLFIVDRGLGEPPVQLLLVAGEVVYQLRSALDHSIFILANKAAKGDRQFPIFKKPDEYKTRSPSMIKGVSPRADAIIEKSQPFQSSTPDEHPLSKLSKLNNTDKHRVIPACSICVSHGNIDFVGGPISFINFANLRVPKDGTKLAELRLPKEFTPEMKMDSETFFSVAFTEVGFTKLEPAVPLLYQLVGYVTSLIDALRGEF